MLHTEDKIKFPADNLQSLLKLFSMFKIGIWCDETIGNEDVIEAIGTMCINCGEILFFVRQSNYRKIITPFVTNMVF